MKGTKKIVNNQYKHEYNGSWIGVDFDGVLAEYHGWKGALVFGKPITLMVERVKKWRSENKKVKVFTARASYQDEIKLDATIEEVVAAIQDWCEVHIGERLEVTCEKDYLMDELWDDRAIQLELNTGKIVEEELQKKVDDAEKKLKLYSPKYSKPRNRACCTCENCRSWMDEENGFDGWELDCNTGNYEQVDQPDSNDFGCKEWRCDHLMCGGDRSSCKCLEGLSESGSLRVHLHRNLEQFKKMRNCGNCNGTSKCKYKARGECQDTIPSQEDTYLVHWEMDV